MRNLFSSNPLLSKTAIPLHEEAKNRLFYHGTPDEASAQAIISGGIQPREITMPDKAKSKAQLAPARGRVYLTSELGYAAIYALGGSLFGHDNTFFLQGKDPYGYIFAIEGSNIQGDIVPDEDSIGQFLSDRAEYTFAKEKITEIQHLPDTQRLAWEKVYNNQIAQYESSPLAKAPQVVIWDLDWVYTYKATESQQRGLREGYIGAQAAVGKKAQPHLRPETIKWMLDNGAHTAHLGAIHPTRAWKFLKTDAAKVKQEEEVMSICTEIPMEQTKVSKIATQPLGEDVKLVSYWNSGEYNPKDKRVVASPQFDSWFQGSKVVDSEGKPLRVFHGTGEDFDEFSKGDIGFHVGNVDQANKRLNSPDKKLDAPNPRIMPLYASIKKPLRLRDIGDWSNPFQCYAELLKVLSKTGRLNPEIWGEYKKSDDTFSSPETQKYLYKTMTNTNIPREERFKILRKAVTDLGYDGIVYRNRHEGKGDSWIAFNANQIKSAIGNNGNFDSKDNKITASKYNEETGWRAASEVQIGDYLVMPGTVMMEVSRITPEGDELVMQGNKGRVRRFSPDDVVNVLRRKKVANRDYTAYVLTGSSRKLLLEKFSPKFPDVVAHHVTVIPPTSKEQRVLPPEAELQVIGYASDESLEAVVVAVNGDSTRPDGVVYHVTLSLDKSKGRKPQESDAVIKNGWEKVPPFAIQATPQVVKKAYIDRSMSKTSAKAGGTFTVYHGTDQEIDSFEDSYKGSAHGKAPINMAGFNFTDSEEVARTFGANVVKAKVRIDKPFVVDVKGASYSDFKHILNSKIEKAKNAPGCDGLIVKNYADAGKHGEDYIVSTHYIPFSTGQIQVLPTVKTSAKAASPDFGYSQYNNKEKELKKLRILEPDLGIHLLEAEAIDPNAKAMDRTQAYVVAEYLTTVNNGTYSFAITQSKIVNNKWVGTGLGQMLYDSIIRQAKKRGADFLYSDKNRSPEADKAWGRLAKRYPVAYEKDKNRNVIDLRKIAKTASQNFPSFEDLCAKHGGFEGLVSYVGSDDDWDRYAPYGDEEEEEYNALSPEDQKQWIVDRAYEEWYNRYSIIIYEHYRRTWPAKVWREMTLNNIQELKKEGFGIYWSYEEGAAEAHWSGAPDGKHYTFEASINESDVDWDSTLLTNLNPSLGDDEKELTLKEGAPIKLLRWKCREEGDKWQKARPEWKSVTASPDFGYSQYNDREKDLKKVKFVSQGVEETGFDEMELGVAAKYNSKDIGYIECQIVGGVCTVYIVSINEDWRGTGLGQLLYDYAIQEAKKAGCSYFSSDSQLSVDAQKAWTRIKSRYPVVEVPNDNYEPDREVDEDEYQSMPTLQRIDLSKVPTTNLRTKKKLATFSKSGNCFDGVLNRKTAEGYPALPNFYDLFESDNPGCKYGIYDLLCGEDDWQPYEDRAKELAAAQGWDLSTWDDDAKDEWIYKNIARADLEAKFNVVRERFAKMKFPLTVYRAVDLDKLSDLRTSIAPGKKPKNKLVPWSHEAFGHSWAWDEKGANNYGSNWQGSNDYTYIFRGLIASPKDVDWETTLQVNFLMPDEHEIRVLDGSSIQITGYKKHGGQWLEPKEQFKTVTASKLAIQGSTSITATQQPPEGLKLVSYWDWSESGDPNLAENAFIVYAKLNGVMVGDVEFIITKNEQLLPNKVHVEPEFRRKGIASAMYVLAEKETGMKIRRHDLQEPDGAALWDKNPDRKFGSSDLYQEVERFRLKEENFFEWDEDPTCFKEQCYPLSRDLAMHLKAKGFDAEPYHGYFIDDEGQKHNHWWVMIGNTIIDITSDQFYPGEEEEHRIVISEAGDPHYSVKKRKNASDKTPPFSDTRYPNMDSKIFKWESKFLASHKTPAVSDTVFPDVGNDRDSIGEGTNAYANLPEKVDNYLTAPSLKSIS